MLALVTLAALARFAEVAARSAGDAAFASLDPELRERMLGNAELFFGSELGAFSTYVPDPAALSAVRTPVYLAAGERRSDWKMWWAAVAQATAAKVAKNERRGRVLG